jgi:hypothetical protein
MKAAASVSAKTLAQWSKSEQRPGSREIKLGYRFVSRVTSAYLRQQFVCPRFWEWQNASISACRRIRLACEIPLESTWV